MKKVSYRQGDVFIQQINSIPQDAKPQPSQGRIVLAYGEVTGHAHAIHDLDHVDVFVAMNGKMYLKVKGNVALQHEEHGTITVVPGDYEVTIQREYSPERIRNVAD